MLEATPASIASNAPALMKADPAPATRPQRWKPSTRRPAENNAPPLMLEASKRSDRQPADVIAEATRRSPKAEARRPPAAPPALNAGSATRPRYTPTRQPAKRPAARVTVTRV
jgi:hypothetical protein